jgi:Spy/CpxP family protein refolding chaperone
MDSFRLSYSLEVALFLEVLTMKPKVLLSRGLVAAMVALGALATQAAAQSGFPWWKDERVVRELGLTPDQSTRIDGIYRSTLHQLRQSKEELDREEAELSRLIEIRAEEGLVERQVGKVEDVRARLNKTRTLMLLHMVQTLTPKQNAKFKEVHEQWKRDNPRPPRPADPKGRTETR